MSIIIPSKHTAPVVFPKTDYRIVKYLDLTKFISMLYKQSLFFCRVDKLEDHFEGTTSKANFNNKLEKYKYLHDIGFYNKPYDEEFAIQQVKEEYESEKKWKALTCISCWNRSESESAALWKIYSDFQKGIMITSSIEKAKQAFSNTKEDISITEIHYINHNNDEMPDGNGMLPYSFKDLAYHFEDELRFIYTLNDVESGYYYDWSKEEIEEGKYLKVNLNLLIEDIYVSPYSSKWFVDIVQDLINKYGLNITVKKSRLSQ